MTKICGRGRIIFTVVKGLEPGAMITCGKEEKWIRSSVRARGKKKNDVEGTAGAPSKSGLSPPGGEKGDEKGLKKRQNAKCR